MNAHCGTGRALPMFARLWIATALPFAGMSAPPSKAKQPQHARAFRAERRCLLFATVQRHLAAVTALMKPRASAAKAVAATATATVLLTPSTQMRLLLGAAVARHAEERFALQHVAITKTQGVEAVTNGATATNLAAKRRHTFCSVLETMKGRLENPARTLCACPCAVATPMAQRATNRAAR